MIQDNLWTAYLAVGVFFTLCIIAVFLTIRGIVKIAKAVKEMFKEEYEAGYNPDDRH